MGWAPARRITVSGRIEWLGGLTGNVGTWRTANFRECQLLARPRRPSCSPSTSASGRRQSFPLRPTCGALLTGSSGPGADRPLSGRNHCKQTCAANSCRPSRLFGSGNGSLSAAAIFDCTRGPVAGPKPQGEEKVGDLNGAGDGRRPWSLGYPVNWCRVSPRYRSPDRSSAITKRRQLTCHSPNRRTLPPWVAPAQGVRQRKSPPPTQSRAPLWGGRTTVSSADP